MIHDNDGCPVIVYKIVGRYPSKMAASRAMGIGRTTMHNAVEGGRQVGDHWFRYADMPASCQPLRVGKLRGIGSDDGTSYPSISALVRELHAGESPDVQNRNRVRIERAINRGKAYLGHVYHRINGAPR